MRTSPLIGRKAWFGPKRIGWGLGPVSTEGWVLTAVFTLLSRITRRQPGAKKFGYILTVAFLAIVLVKGTSPGGRKAYAAFKQAHTGASAGNEVDEGAAPS